MYFTFLKGLFWICNFFYVCQFVTLNKHLSLLSSCMFLDVFPRQHHHNRTVRRLVNGAADTRRHATRDDRKRRTVKQRRRHDGNVLAAPRRCVDTD